MSTQKTDRIQAFDESVRAEYDKGAKLALSLFHLSAKHVPAYKAFLKDEGIDPAKIKNLEDFKKVTPVTKENYLRKYPLKDLLWNGDMFKNNLISVSSGSSGEPFFWFRGSQQHEEASEIYYKMYKDVFEATNKSTLLVVCFSMGTWIAGSYTTLGGMAAADKGLKINVVTPAIEIKDALSVIKKLHVNYEQVILAGYPPLVKDLIDQGAQEGIDWRSMDVGFTVAGESVSEELRDYYIEYGTQYTDPTKVINIYGTADAGIIAHETPVSIEARRFIAKDLAQVDEVFGRRVLPTLAQFDPMQRFFEEVDGDLIFTAASGIPLIRYNIKDAGGLYFGLEDLLGTKKLQEFSNTTEFKKLDLEAWSRPFVYVHGRNDFTATLYAVLIYPENIKTALFDDALSQIVTTKFSMTTEYESDLNQFLEIHVELQAGLNTSEDLVKVITDRIIVTLTEVNAEYRKLRASVGERATPKVYLHTYGGAPYFGKGNKQTWKIK